jgi:hypothetical protein
VQAEEWVGAEAVSPAVSALDLAENVFAPTAGQPLFMKGEFLVMNIVALIAASR